MSGRDIEALIDEGQRIREAGIRPYPSGEDKKPIRGLQWGPWAFKPPADDAQIAKWAANPKTLGWVGLCGAHDDGICCLDIEAPGLVIEDIRSLTLQAPTFCQYVSKSGGVHVWVEIVDFAEAGPVLTEKIAQRDTGQLDKHGNPIFDLLIEVRGASKNPANAGAYAQIVGPGRPGLRRAFRPWKITRADYETLIEPIRELDDWRPWRAARAAEKAANARNRPSRPLSGTSTADLILDAVATGVLSPEEILPEGWKHIGDEGRRQLIRRPDATSPTSGNVLEGIVTIWSSAVPWADPGEPMAPAKVLAESRHHGDFHAAMQAVEDAATGKPSAYSGWPSAVLEAVAANRQREREDYLAATSTSGAVQSSSSNDRVSETDETNDSANTGPRLWSGLELRESEPTRWLVRGQLPLAQVAVLIGDEGVGKSLWWVLVVAHITTGAGDDRLGIPPGRPRDVVLVLTEDAWTTDVRPRLETAGADLSRVHVLAEEEDGSGSAYLDRDRRVIEEAAEDLDVALIVVDAWLDTVGSGTQVKDPQQARQALAPVHRMAQTTGASVLLVAHSNRADDGNLRNRVGATGALRQKARVLLYAARPPETDDVLYLGPDKANGARLGNAIAYRLRVEQVRPASDDDPGTVARLQVIGDTGATMATHYARWRAEAHKREHPDADERAWRWLQAYIAENGIDAPLGRQVDAAEAKEAGRLEGHNPQRLAKVIKAHNGYAGPDGAGASWVYRLHLTGGITLKSSDQSSQTSQSSPSFERGSSTTNTDAPAPEAQILDFNERKSS